MPNKTKAPAMRVALRAVAIVAITAAWWTVLQVAADSAERQSTAYAAAPVVTAAKWQAIASSGNTASARDVILSDGTPVRLRISQTVSSATAEVGDRIEFEVLDEVRVENFAAIHKRATAYGWVNEARPKKRLGRGGRLGIALDYVQLANGQKARLRAEQAAQGSGRHGAMTGAIAGSAVVLPPAAPFFLFVEGKEAELKKGAEVVAYVNGDTLLSF